tara:strand:+ start:1842 stop:2996 length:1155 start_codon:yes stop_codon:yes gene_type:complete
MAVKKTKKKSVRKTRAQVKTLDEQYIGSEPGVDFFEEGGNLHRYFNWYNYMYDRKKVNQVIISYAKQFGYKNAPKFARMFLPQSLAAIITGLERGVKFPIHNDFPEEEGLSGYQKFIHQELRSWNKSAQELNPELLNTDMVVKKKRVSVQENINNKGKSLLGEVDRAIDMWDVEPFDMYKYLTEQKASSAVANSIVNEWEPLIEELKEVKLGECKQLKEGYSHLSKSELDDFYNFVLKIKTDTERYVENNKPVRKPRKAKAINATRAVSKLNYLDHDPENRIKSIDPSKIIGCKQLWVFNSKTNEMIQYNQEDRAGLSVKGTTIQNYDSKSSGSKKLGVKTDHFIDRVLMGGPIVLNKIMSEINSKSSKVTGRINNNMILLKVD